MFAYFEEILPDFDQERVYPNDIKKVITWYNLLVGAGFTSFKEEEEEALKKEALEVGEAAMKFQMNTKNPKGELTVIYRNANTGEVYFEIAVEA